MPFSVDYKDFTNIEDTVRKGVICPFRRDEACDKKCALYLHSECAFYVLADYVHKKIQSRQDY